MSVIITNISDHNDTYGENDYVVRINHQTVATFKHERRKGLAACLRAAAEAVEQSSEDRAFRRAMYVTEKMRKVTT